MNLRLLKAIIFQNSLYIEEAKLQKLHESAIAGEKKPAAGWLQAN
jgi:hypothetical protein